MDRLRIAILALTVAVGSPVTSHGQTPPAEKGGGAPHGVVQCTEAAPCVTPGSRGKPGKIAPGAAAVHQFRETHPCPTTAHTWGACPGYVVNHIKPPCKGGLDAAANLQWQTHADADRQDQTACR